MIVAQADLCNLAGWIAFDTGRSGAARVHFGRALDLARLAGRADLVANIHYRMGRIELHHGATQDALLRFQAGRTAAEEPGSVHMIAILCANEAWAHAKMGATAEAKDLLGQATDAMARTNGRRLPGWEMFFTEPDLLGMTGSVYTDLALRSDRRYTGIAIPALSSAIAGYGEGMARSRAFCLISLSLNHLLEGDSDQAGTVGMLAIKAAASLKSARTKERMRPLLDEADRRLSDPLAGDLADCLRAFELAPAEA
jgi:hypothetical protein